MSNKFNFTENFDQQYIPIFNNYISENRYVEATLFIHQEIEFLLRNILFVIGNQKEDKRIIKTKIESIEKMTFDQLLLVHLFLETIDFKLFSEIQSVAKMRARIAHKIKYFKPVSKYKGEINTYLETCNAIYSICVQRLNERAKEIK